MDFKKDVFCLKMKNEIVKIQECMIDTVNGNQACFCCSEPFILCVYSSLFSKRQCSDGGGPV